MEKSDDKLRETAESQTLREAIRQARVAEAEKIDAEVDGRSAELARLEILRGDLEKLFDEIPGEDDRFELALAPTTPARLWIDMFTYVAMDRDAATYRLIRNHREGRRILVESGEVGEMCTHIAGYVARKVVERERIGTGIADFPRAAPAQKQKSSAGLVFAAFLFGVLTGAAGLMAVGWLLAGSPQ